MIRIKLAGVISQRIVDWYAAVRDRSVKKLIKMILLKGLRNCSNNSYLIAQISNNHCNKIIKISSSMMRLPKTEKSSLH